MTQKKRTHLHQDEDSTGKPGKALTLPQVYLGEAESSEALLIWIDMRSVIWILILKQTVKAELKHGCRHGSIQHGSIQHGCIQHRSIQHGCI